MSQFTEHIRQPDLTNKFTHANIKSHMTSSKNHVTQCSIFVSALYRSILFYLPQSRLFSQPAHASNLFSPQNPLFHRPISTKFLSHHDQHLFSSDTVSIHFILSQTHKYTHITITPVT